MSDVDVVGGLYGERCLHPDVDELYGSGGRAAMAIARSGRSVTWHYHCPESLMHAAQQTIAMPGLNHMPQASQDQVTFKYTHPLSRPVYFPGEITPAAPIEVKSQNVLRFGLMEGEAIVDAQTCVFDPQSHLDPKPFQMNGSKAEKLAIVLNASEITRYTATADEQAAIDEIETGASESIVLVKSGADGCRVYESGKLVGTVPPYWSDRIYKIGTGDVFSAAFAANWMLEGRSSLEAADVASRCVAHYTECRTPTVSEAELYSDRKPLIQKTGGLVYIAGPIFTMSELWLVNEASDALEALGVDTFSPYRDVGYGDPYKVVPADLDGLERATAVLAILEGCDPGTMFEIGYAIKKGLPVVCFSENPKHSDLTMISGSPNCRITNDFATAIYQATWAARS